MIKESIKKRKLKVKRKLRVRKKLRGSAQKPRLCVIKSNLHIHLQLIDDQNGHTLVSASTLSKSVKGSELMKRGKSTGKALGKMLAEEAAKKNIKQVIFDRGSSKFHGILAEIAEGVREGGVRV